MKRTFRNDETGMVAIMVTMIMMFVITLIVLGFASNTRRNQREALDSQLGTQAYYAAETGVNDVVNAINASATTDSLAHTDCSAFTPVKDDGTSLTTLPRQLNGSQVANTCLMVNTKPVSLITDSIAVTTDTVQWHVEDADSRPFTKLSFSWQPDGDTSGCSSTFKTYPSATNWNCNYALLRVDLIPASAVAVGQPLDAATLASKTATLYLQPYTGSEVPITINGFGAGNPTAYQGACHTTNCTVDVNLGGGAQETAYYVRLTALYRTATSVTLDGTDTVGPAHFDDGQIVVDSTGRAQDQLKRIRVRIPLSGTVSSQPVFAVQSAGTICKDLLYFSNSVYQPGQCTGIWPTTP